MENLTMTDEKMAACGRGQKELSEQTMNANHSESAGIFKADVNAAMHFISLLAEDDFERLTFQTFDDRKGISAERKNAARIIQYEDGCMARLASLNNDGNGIFVTVNATDGKGRKAENIVSIRALFVDLDGAPLEPVLAGGAEPHIVVETSPGRFHCYWLIADCGIHQFSAIQNQLAKKFNGDKSVHDLPRVMRLPGFFHQKQNPPVMTKIIRESGALPYTISEFIEKQELEMPGASRSITAAPRNPETDAELRARILSADAGMIYPAMLSLSARMIGRGMSDEDCASVLQSLLDASSLREVDPQTWQARCSDIPAMIATARRKFGDPRAGGHAGVTVGGEIVNGDDGDLDSVDAALVNTMTESNMALAFSRKYRGAIFHCHETGRWHLWTGNHWQVDKSRRAFNWAVEMARIHGDGSKTVGKAGFASGVERIAAAEPALAVELNRLDLNRDLLATPDGTINLLTGEIHQANPDHLITRIAGCSPKLGLPVRFIDFLLAAFDGDEERVEFIQEFLGYCLTGRTGAEKFLYFDGPGGNGKGCLSTLMQCILGDYFAQAPASMLMYSSTPQHSTDLAALRGKRMVVASELPPGARLDEQRLKSITGGDPVTARLMHQDNTTFQPELKLVIASNHRPSIVRPDEAMRRRVLVMRMPNAVQNPDPAFKSVILPSEAPQALNWLLEGAVRVLARNERFLIPQVVLDQSAEYLGSMDAVGTFIAECTSGRKFGVSEPRSAVYNAYREWCEQNNERPLSARPFYEDMANRGYAAKILAGMRLLDGIKLNTNSNDGNVVF
jgi:putative DNA primase/helicase